MSLNRWMLNKMWYIYTVGYYLAKKKINEISIHSKTRMNLGNILLGEISQTQKNKWQMILLFHLYMEKAMAPHSSTLAWKIPWTEEPGRLWSMGWLRVGHNWATSLSLFTFMHWRRKWQPTPVFLPGESQGRGSLVVCRLWGRTEPDTTEVT